MADLDGVMRSYGSHIDHVPPGELREGEAAVGGRLLSRRPLSREQRLSVTRREELEVVCGVRVDACMMKCYQHKPVGTQIEILRSTTLKSYYTGMKACIHSLPDGGGCLQS